MSVVNMHRKKVLYVGMRDDYGDAARGISFEKRKFHDPLIHYRGLEVPGDLCTEWAVHGFPQDPCGQDGHGSLTC